MQFDEIKKIVDECLTELLDKDFLLFRHDVSERSITHKFAEYLQIRFPQLNVDCEYNRNVEKGEFASKELIILQEMRDKEINKTENKTDEEFLLTVSTYPDIIIHRRTKNDENLLVIEV